MLSRIFEGASALRAPRALRRAFALSFIVALSLAHATPAQSQSVLTLGDAMAALEEDNLELASSALSIEQAELLVRQARSLLRPTINAAGTYTLRDQAIEFETGNPYMPLAPYLQAAYEGAGGEVSGLPDPALLVGAESEPMVVQYRHDIGGSISIDQSLFNARAMPLIRQARIGIRQAENNRELVRYQLQGAVSQLYFVGVLQRRLVEVSQRNVSLARVSLQRATIALEEEVGTQFEVNRAQVEVSRAEREVDNAETAYRITIRNLATLLNRDADFDVAPPSAIDIPASLPALAEDRPELAAYDLGVEMQEQRLAETRSGWFPTVFARGQVNLQRATAFGGERVSWFIQIGANWNLYDGGVRAGDRRIRQSELSGFALEREATLRQLEAQVEATAMEIEQLTRDIESARADLELASENLELTDTAFQFGVANQLDTQMAREQVFLSELALATAEVNRQAKLYELLRLVGERPWE